MFWNRRTPITTVPVSAKTESKLACAVKAARKTTDPEIQGSLYQAFKHSVPVLKALASNGSAHELILWKLAGSHHDTVVEAVINNAAASDRLLLELIERGRPELSEAAFYKLADRILTKAEESSS